MKAAALAVLIAALIPLAAEAKPAPARVDVFNGDRYVSVAQGMTAREVATVVRHKARKGKRVPLPRPRPGVVTPLTLAQGIKREAIEAMPTRSLAGVVAPLAAKTRDIVSTCGSTVISTVRHTRIAGTGGRLSLHASGRAVDIKGNPGCIYGQLHGWPGGYSVDYGAVQHVHVSYAPGGPEWGVRFRHYRGHRHRHRRRA